MSEQRDLDRWEVPPLHGMSWEEMASAYRRYREHLQAQGLSWLEAEQIAFEYRSELSEQHRDWPRIGPRYEASQPSADVAENATEDREVARSAPESADSTDPIGESNTSNNSDPAWLKNLVNDLRKDRQGADHKSSPDEGNETEGVST